MRKKMDRWMTVCLALLAAGYCRADAPPVVRLDFNNAYDVAQVQMNGLASTVEVNGRQRLRLTQDLNEAASVWLLRPLKLPAYIVEFDFEVTRTDPKDSPADGFTFAAQQYGPVALGDGGGGLGYTHIPGYSYAVEFNDYSVQGLPGAPETVGVDVIGMRTKFGQVAFPHVDRGVFHAKIAVRREGIEVTVSGGKGNLPPTKLVTTPWWLLFDTEQTMWVGLTGATGGLRSSIDILNLTLTPLQ